MAHPVGKTIVFGNVWYKWYKGSAWNIVVQFPCRRVLIMSSQRAGRPSRISIVTLRDEAAVEVVHEWVKSVEESMKTWTKKTNRDSRPEACRNMAEIQIDLHVQVLSSCSADEPVVHEEVREKNEVHLDNQMR